MGYNFPELLARDLEVSAEAFTSKRMTAGAPSRGLASEPEDAILRAPKALSFVSDRLEENTPDPFEEHHGHDDDPSKELPLKDEVGEGSETSSESTGTDEPPSIRFRHSLVTTAATSITSARHSLSLSLSRTSGISPLTPSNPDRKGSWVDFDAGEGKEDLHSSPGRVEPAHGTLRPRRPYSSLGISEAERSFTMPTAAEMLAGTAMLNAFQLPFQGDRVERPHTSSGGSSKAQTFMPPHQIMVPTRRSSLTHHQQYELAQAVMAHSRTTSLSSTLRHTQEIALKPALPAPAPSPKISDTEGTDDTLLSSSATGAKGVEIKVDSDVDSDGNDESLADLPPSQVDDVKAGNRKSVFASEKALANIHSWLESSVGLQPPARTGQPVVAAGIPLPAEVMSNLRLSTSGFPETMLLSSSLTVETIRTYSRKLRHAADKGPEECDPVFSPLNATTPRQKRASRFPILSKKKSQQLPVCPSTALAQSPSRTSAVSGQVGAPNWSALRSVFPTGSDYLCDALYAHIIAYNYIGPLCPEPPPAKEATPSTRLLSPHSTPLYKAAVVRRAKEIKDGEDDARKIPKKAASLLGLNGAGGEPTDMAATNRFWQMRNGMSAGRPGVGLRRTDPGAAAQLDTSLLDLHAALGRCIVRLVATLRMTMEEVGKGCPEGERVMGEVDPFFLRALCELVRVSEDVY